MMRSVRIARALRAVIVPAVVAALVAFPLGVLASHSFSDVPTSHPFHADIAALKDSGVSTTGCGGGKFCPEDYVTRGQMAAFLNRLGALSPSKTPVANATTVDRLSANELIRVAFAEDNDAALVGSVTVDAGTVLSTTITAPVNGYLVVNAGSDVFGNDYGTNCWLSFDTVQYAPSRRSVEANQPDSEEDCSTEGVMAVAAGTHTVSLDADGLTDGMQYDEASMSVLFTPFGATGAQPVSITKITKTPVKGNQGN